jgi:tRNA-specific 2-thiouridylase
VKLGTLRSYANRIGAKYIATGHYARLEQQPDGPHLFRGTPAKDQAYALAQLDRDQLAGLLLPLGSLEKTATRAHAERLGLLVADKTESQDICFVEGGDYRDILARVAPGAMTPGEIRTAAGELVGAHAGISNYTVGQRRGLPANLGDGPRYVTRIDPATNTIVVGREDELGAWELTADEVNLIRPERFANGPARVLAMTRYRQTPALAHATLSGDGLTVRFEELHQAIAPGQLVALFDLAGDEVLGAATIREAA